MVSTNEEVSCSINLNNKVETSSTNEQNNDNIGLKKDRKKLATCLIEPTRFEFKGSTFEYSAYKPSARFLKDFDTIFPTMSITERNQIIVLPIMQKCEYSMVGVSKVVNDERDVKLELFVEWGKKVVDRLGSVGLWSELMDPASGYPVFGKAGPSPYPDVQGTMLLTSRFDVQNVGCCHILLHPQWDSHIYPATMFTTAPVEILEKVLAEINL